MSNCPLVHKNPMKSISVMLRKRDLDLNTGLFLHLKRKNSKRQLACVQVYHFEHLAIFLRVVSSHTKQLRKQSMCQMLLKVALYLVHNEIQ